METKVLKVNEIAQEKDENLRDVSSSDGLSSGRVRTDNITDLSFRSFLNLFTKFEESSGCDGTGGELNYSLEELGAMGKGGKAMT